MKVYRLQAEVCTDFIHNFRTTQDRLYVPKHGVIGYRHDKIDFFSDDEMVIKKAEKAIANKNVLSTDEYSINYVGEIELPDDVVLNALSAGKELNRATEEFQESAKTLIGLVK